MNSNTKFFRLIDEFVIQSQRKLWIFQSIVTVSIFALFLGFVCGNLFGTFLNYFRNFVQWDGFIISLTILVIEFINYLNFRHPLAFAFSKAKGCSSFFSNFFSPRFLSVKNWKYKSQPKTIGELLSLNKLFYAQPLQDKTFRQIKRFSDSKKDLTVQLPCSDNYYWIKILNFYKIGLLLGFFIDAFKVGS